MSYTELIRHVGHKIVCVTYGQPAKPVGVSVECETCWEALITEDNPVRSLCQDEHTPRIEEVL
jgi:hypothetical protein